MNLLLYTTLHGRKVHYDDAGAGAPLLLMHAFPVDRTMFAPLPGFRLVTFDVPPGPVTMDLIADFAAGLLDRLGLERAVVGGVSMGGYAAFRFLARHPERLAGLVLSNTRPAPDTEAVRASRRDMMEVARRQGPAEVANRMIPRLLGETTRWEYPEAVARVRRMIEAQSAEAIVQLLEALANRPDSTPLLASIRVPTVVIAGEEDVIVSPEETRSWSAHIPGVQLHVIPRCGHLPPVERPDAFARAIERLAGGL